MIQSNICVIHTTRNQTCILINNETNHCCCCNYRKSQLTALVNYNILNSTTVQNKQALRRGPVLKSVALTIENTVKCSDRLKSLACKVEVCTELNLTVSAYISRVVARICSSNKCLQIRNGSNLSLSSSCSISNLRHSVNSTCLNDSTCSLEALCHHAICIILNLNLETLAVLACRNSHNNGCNAILSNYIGYADNILTCERSDSSVLVVNSISTGDSLTTCSNNSYSIYICSTCNSKLQVTIEVSQTYSICRV